MIVNPGTVGFVSTYTAIYTILFFSEILAQLWTKREGAHQHPVPSKNAKWPVSAQVNPITGGGGAEPAPTCSLLLSTENHKLGCTCKVTAKMDIRN